VSFSKWRAASGVGQSKPRNGPKHGWGVAFSLAVLAVQAFSSAGKLPFQNQQYFDFRSTLDFG